jgi:hypothetical protein
MKVEGEVVRLISVGKITAKKNSIMRKYSRQDVEQLTSVPLRLVHPQLALVTVTITSYPLNIATNVTVRPCDTMSQVE